MLHEQIVVLFVITNVKMIFYYNFGVWIPIAIHSHYKSQMHKDSNLETEPMLGLHFIFRLERAISNIILNWYNLICNEILKTLFEHIILPFCLKIVDNKLNQLWLQKGNQQ
jgi:hypothetical protein